MSALQLSCILSLAAGFEPPEAGIAYGQTMGDLDYTRSDVLLEPGELQSLDLTGVLFFVLDTQGRDLNIGWPVAGDGINDFARWEGARGLQIRTASSAAPLTRLFLRNPDNLGTRAFRYLAARPRGEAPKFWA